MKRGLGVLLAMAMVGCSGLTAVEGGVVGIEVSFAGPDSLEVGESIQLSAKPLDKNGDSVAAPVTWTSSDPTATIDPTTGLLTGVGAGSARIQARVGSLGSSILVFAVLASPDTLAISGDSILTVSLAVGFPELVTTLNSFNPPGPVISHPVVYAITSPDPLTTQPSVVFTDREALADTVATASDGTGRSALTVLPGTTPPDSVIVQISAQHLNGAPVAGSGQRFILRLTP